MVIIEKYFTKVGIKQNTKVKPNDRIPTSTVTIFKDYYKNILNNNDGNKARTSTSNEND